MSVRAWLSRGWKAHSVETLAAEYSQWFGRNRGEKVKPGEETETTQRKRKKKSRRNRAKVADLNTTEKEVGVPGKYGRFCGSV